MIVLQSDNECWIITSPCGVCQYYYAVHKEELFHGDTVIDVLKKSRLRRSWNWKALADLAQLDHLLENDTLHRQIHRVPRGSILHFRDGVLDTSCVIWKQSNLLYATDPDSALTAFNNETRQWISDNVVVSMSGGFDSRVVLSSLLKHGCTPSLLTMGFEDSTDVVISQKISSVLGLDLSVVMLRPQDYLDYGKTIVALTNGTKTAQHWHTYLYVNKAKLNPNCVFFVGCNGEYARSYYLDKGIIALAANIAAPLSLQCFWRRKLESLFKKEELNNLRPELSNEFTKNGQGVRIRRIMNLCHNRLVSGLDRFYLEQRLRNFVGNGLRLYSANVSWRAPFLSQEWISAMRHLKTSWKLGSNWHRFAIQKNYPQLLDFPEERKADSMYPKAPQLYWLPIRNKRATIPYARYPEWFRSGMILEFLHENASLLSELIEPNTVVSIVKKHRREGKRTNTIAFLLTMMFWVMNLKDMDEG